MNCDRTNCRSGSVAIEACCLYHLSQSHILQSEYININIDVSNFKRYNTDIDV